MKAALLSLIGQYVPSSIPLYNDDMEIVLYLVGPDWAWIFSCIFAVLFTWCILRLLGGLLCRT